MATPWTPEILIQSVIATTGSARQAADLLGISRDTVHKVRDGGFIGSQATKDKIWNAYRGLAAGKDNPFRQEIGAAKDALGRFKTPESRAEIVRKTTTEKGHDEFLARVAREQQVWKNKQKRAGARRDAQEERDSDPSRWKR